MDKTLGMGLSAALKRLPFDQELPEKVERGDTPSLKRGFPFRRLFSQEAFLSACRRMYRNFGESEFECIYDKLMQLGAHKEIHEAGIFSLILKFAQRHLKAQGTELFYKQKDLILWRDTVHEIGQTPFICAYRADQDLHMGIERTRFDFPPFLHTDDLRLRNLLAEGVAENHFHLKGSSPMSLINWICLMNHTTYRKKQFEQLGPQLNNVSPDVSGKNGERLHRYVKLAAKLRLFLWLLLEGGTALEKFRQRFDQKDFLRDIFSAQPAINWLRARNPKSLDYACDTSGPAFGPRSFWAATAGENRFL